MLSDGFDLWLEIAFIEGAALPVDYAQPFFESLGISHLCGKHFH